MKKIQFLIACIAVIAFNGCTVDERSVSFINNVPAPSNMALAYSVTNDNTGLVTLTPNADGATQFEVAFGDGSGSPVTLSPGESVGHVYSEGIYDVSLIATGINGLTTELVQPLVVSFLPPQNLEVVIENDGTISKTVNITATAELAINYEVTFGEPGNDTPVSANIGDTISYTYQEAGIYTISVTAFSAAIETAQYSEDFEVTAILQPIAPAAASPDRDEADYISVYSDVYTNIAGTDFFPDWGQSTTFNEINVEGDNIIQYGGLTYQGIQLGATADASNMEFLHIDVWTAEDLQVELYPISIASGEQQVTLDLPAGAWSGFDIPLSDFTDQGLSMDDIHQFKFVGIPSGEGTIFIDNLYFYKNPGGTITSMIEDFEGPPPAFTSFGNIAPTEVVSNPDPTGINTSPNVAQLLKTAGSETWAGTFFEVAAPLDLNTYNKINVKTWSPNLGQVKLKIENADATITWEQDLNSTVTNEWENLLYDFSGAPAADYVRIVIFFDFGNPGDDSLYYYDDVELVNNDGGAASLGFEDFEGTPPAFTVFGNIAQIEVIANPDASGENTTANVAQLIKSAGSETWAGGFFEVPAPLDLNTYSKIRVKTWSPNQGQIKVKLENADATITWEQDLNPSVTNAWETLTYDFSGAPAADYVRVVIFFDFGNPGDDSVYYFDEYALTN